MKNRSIKFRAWDKKKKKMLGIVDLSQNKKYWKFDLGNNDDYILMQCTGLKDKNGVEIYEGDIVKQETFRDDDYAKPKHDWSNNCVVEWKDGSFILRDIDDYEGRLVSVSSIYDEINPRGKYASVFKVIGNIYENSELIKVSQELPKKKG